MSRIRTKAIPLAVEALKGLDAHEYKHLRVSGAANKNYWSSPGEKDKPAVQKFKSEIKEHYYYEQTRLCCYCSSELSRSQASYDAEHIIDKSGNPEYMFDLNNLAVACKLCNTTKGKRPVLAIAGPFAAVPTLSENYLIVHPHLDEWGDHLDYDAIGRIVEIGNSAKGRYTIGLCGIGVLNAMRLSDAFTPKGNRVAEKTIRSLVKMKQSARKRKKIAFLEELADKFNSSSAKAIVNALRAEHL